MRNVCFANDRCRSRRSIQKVIDDPKGHRLCITSVLSTWQPLIFCNRCYAYASTNPHLLAHICKGLRVSRSKTGLFSALTVRARFRNRQHPIDKHRLDIPRRLT